MPRPAACAAAQPVRRRSCDGAVRQERASARRRKFHGDIPNEARGRQLTATLEEVLPLLGLVLFGDPQVAKKFYRENLAVAMDRLAQAWREVENRYGFAFESPDIAARAVMGMALLLALESHHGRKFDRGRAVSKISEGTVKGFFPQLVPAQTVGASGDG